MHEPAITPELIARHNLTPEEYTRVTGILGRTPSYAELGVFSVMWSEHCSYKNTRPLLKLFPTRSPRVLVGAGEENAGVLDIGDGLAVAFKIESHNHPSAVEPFQGAATGVGGIIRDIFTMGARPVAALNSLRFGELDRPDVRRLFQGAVSGIAHYGNCFGIPMVGGEIAFDPSYEGNPLVNAFCLGVLRGRQVIRGRAAGVGNPVFYVGPATGRDGLAGAAFASQDLTEESAEQQRGAVQVGDPFMEKLVCEACLELLATGAVAGIQDMGAAGLACSTCETAARAGTGIEIELDRTPQRAPGMSAYEMLLSESQERMLIIVHRGREGEVRRIFDKWDLPWAEIGSVTDTGRMVVKQGGRVVADIPARQLADDAPVYHREAREPARLAAERSVCLADLPETSDPLADLETLLSWPSIASKQWVYRQYDHMVRDGSVVPPGSDAAVIRIKADSLPPLPADDAEAGAPPPEKFLAMTVDGNGAYVWLDPYEGGKATVVEAARNLACSGAAPIGATDNLNFANPYDPEQFYYIREAVRGLADACRALRIPVVGGNCSLYNQNPAGPIDPTPTVAMVGLFDSAADILTQDFKGVGDAILLLGDPVDANDRLLGLGGSAWLRAVHRRKSGSPPPCDLERAAALHEGLQALARGGDLKSAHDCSDGGLLVALAEACFCRDNPIGEARTLGLEVDLSEEKTGSLAGLLFGEAHSRVVVSTAAENAGKLAAQARALGLTCRRLGFVRKEGFNVQLPGGEIRGDVARLRELWWNGLERALQSTPEAQPD